MTKATKEKQFDEIIDGLCHYFDWDKDSEQAFSVREALEESFKAGEEKAMEDMKWKYEQEMITVSREARREGEEEMREKVAEIKKRFRCGACDGAKCEHTLGCKALSELLKSIKKS